MTGLLRSELRKVTGTKLALGLLLGVLALTGLALGVTLWGPTPSGAQAQGIPTTVETGADVVALLGVSGVSSIFALVFGTIFAATEFRHDTAATTFLSEPRRWRVLVAKGAVAAGVGAVYAAVVLLASLAMVWVDVRIDGGALPMDATVWLYMGMSLPSAATIAVFGVGIGAALRNQVGAIVAVLVWVFAVESLIAALLPEVAPWTPFAVGAAMTTPTDDVGRALGTTLALAWTVTAVAVGTWLTERRDAV